MTTNNNQAEQIKWLASERLKSPIYNALANAYLLSSGQDGQLAKEAKHLGFSGISGDIAFEEKIAPHLLGNEELQKEAVGYVEEGLGYAKVEEVMKLLGSKVTPHKSYKTKEVRELGKEQQQIIYGTYFGNLTDASMSNALGMRNSMRIRQLEKTLKAA